MSRIEVGLDSNGERHGEAVEYFEEGELEFFDDFSLDHYSGNLYHYRVFKEKCTYIHGKKEGLGLYYNSKNAIISEFMYLDGKKEGKEIWFNDEGSIRRECMYVNGKKEGREYFYFDDEGSISRECMYVNGKKEGKEIRYSIIWYGDEPGKRYINIESTYVNGKKEGREYEYYDYRVIRISTYVNGKKEGIEIYNNVLYNNFLDLSYEKRNYVNGVIQGKEIKYWLDGTYEERNYVDGVIQGKATYHWPDGDYEERTYTNDELHGKAILYDKLGNVIDIYNYVNGEKQ